jgi:hypothetical protein
LDIIHNQRLVSKVSEFVISGLKRRELKKKLNSLKSSYKMFWHYEDIDRVYGGGSDDFDCEQILEKIKLEIIELEKIISERK